MSEATVKKCKIENCKRPYRAKGYCNVHFNKWRKGELDTKPRYKICSEEKCNGELYRWGLCKQHYDAKLASKKPVVEAAPAPAAEAAPAADAPATDAAPQA